MVTRRDLRLPAGMALVTATFLAASLALLAGGPPSAHPNAVLSWHAANAAQVRAGWILWLLAMLCLVVFAVGFREALWATVADRSWTTVLFVQGAGVFATVAVVAAAIGWALAGEAQAGTIGAELATTVWGIQEALLRFATWGFTVPLVVVATALYRHSIMGQLCAVAAFLVAGALLVPLTWAVALYAFPAWLVLVGVTLLVPSLRRARHPAPVR